MKKNSIVLDGFLKKSTFLTLMVPLVMLMGVSYIIGDAAFKKSITVNSKITIGVPSWFKPEQQP